MEEEEDDDDDDDDEAISQLPISTTGGEKTRKPTRLPETPKTPTTPETGLSPESATTMEENKDQTSVKPSQTKWLDLIGIVTKAYVGISLVGFTVLGIWFLRSKLFGKQ